MIRINLLAVERERVKRKATFQFAEKVTVACSLILVGTGVFIGWWYWSLSSEAADLDSQIAAARNETTRLKAVLARVQQVEQKNVQLQQRIALIEQLRKSQTAGVRLLDEVSRALPNTLWLTSLTEKDTTVTLEGRCLALTAVSDLVANVQASPYFKKPIESPTLDSDKSVAGVNDLFKFTLKLEYLAPGAAPPPAAPAPAVAAASAKR